ncbi:Zinc finger, C2H2 [Artemisia annua]|uniref:Zinc finger, C2H2 n=1 Tax=Artemisia annua TaxID=35608 RepID=A0A2U1MDN5_ARTAN|nr:Zinc finger, C2H2 [Artemisia annua]
MDDTCVVCAESLEWVAYGPCGHKDVCSTCVARLRCICNDRHCCICKTHSSTVFVTKALGDYTKTVHDFTVFPAVDKEGRSGPYWYHEDTQSYFDDVEQYKMIKAMCRLSCSACDKVDEKRRARFHDINQLKGHLFHQHKLFMCSLCLEGRKYKMIKVMCRLSCSACDKVEEKRRARFRDINQLKGHLFHQHKLFMCSLCLEGMKVFICEQKLYNKAHLKQHINTGDSEVDGSESERGGFQGHPLCEFYRRPFYGDNELYTHMSTEHFTCHICKRFIFVKGIFCVRMKLAFLRSLLFLSPKQKHNALEHRGRMSRSKRNAILQLPTAFTYQRSNEQDNRHGRRHAFQHDVAEYELPQAIEASFETANLNTGFPESMHGFEPLLQSSTTIGTESDRRYFMAVSHSLRNAPLEDSSFPPLSMGPSGGAPKPDGPPRNTMTDNLRRLHPKIKINVLNVGQAWPAASRFDINQFSSSSVSRPTNTASLVVSGQRS